MTNKVTFEDVQHALLARVEAHIADTSETHRVDVYGPEEDDVRGPHVVWGGTLEQLRDALRGEMPSWLWETVELRELGPGDLEDHPYLHVRAAPPPETIATAAIRVEHTGAVWTLPRPARHHVLIQAYHQAHRGHGAYLPITTSSQGFVTSKGRFVDRAEAERIARAAGQVKGELIGSELTSEDLW